MTIVYDEIVEDLDIQAALVFGVVWRHENMSHGYCHASIETMACLTGLGERTVQYRLRLLEERGYIMRIGAAFRWTPAGYKVTYTPLIERNRAKRSETTGVQEMRP